MSIEADTSSVTHAERWGACAILLSLDCMEPFFGPMGLSLDAGTLKLALREAIVAFRASLGQEAPPVSAFADRALESLKLRLRDHGEKEFLVWFSDVFSISVHDHGAWQQWKSAFLRFSANAQGWEKLILPSRHAEPLYARYLGLTRTADIWKIWARMRSQPLSDWDVEMYAIHAFDDESKDPFNWVILTYELNGFRNFWSVLKSTLSEGEMMDLWQGLKGDSALDKKSYLHDLPNPLGLTRGGHSP